MTKLAYQCPHCNQRVEVENEQVGKISDCQHCGKPFQAEAPVGRLMVQRGGGQWSVASDALVGKAPTEERKIMTVHPAVFRAHPIKSGAAVAAVIIGVIGMIYFAIPGENRAISSWWRPITIALSFAFAILAISSLFSIAYWFVRSRYDSLTITEERTVWARGILDRATSEVQHDDVRNIQIKQTFFDRIFGVGRIAISSAGQDEMEIDIRDVPNPDEVAKVVRSCQARMEGRDD